jgi:hypothetical protein
MIHSLNKYSLRPKDIVQFTILLRPIYIVELLLGRVRALECAVVERQGTSNVVVRERVLSSHPLLAHVGKFVIVSTDAFHDLDKAGTTRQEHILQLVVAHCVKGIIHDDFDQLIDVVWRLLALKRLDRSENPEIEKKFI